MDEQDYRYKSLCDFQRAALVMVAKQLKRIEDHRSQAGYNQSIFRTQNNNLSEIGTYVSIQVTDKKFWFSYHIEIENWTSESVGEVASVK